MMSIGDVVMMNLDVDRYPEVAISDAKEVSVLYKQIALFFIEKGYFSDAGHASFFADHYEEVYIRGSKFKSREIK